MLMALEQWLSKRGPGNPGGSAQNSLGASSVKTTFLVVLKHHLSFHSHFTSVEWSFPKSTRRLVSQQTNAPERESGCLLTNQTLFVSYNRFSFAIFTEYV